MTVRSIDLVCVAGFFALALSACEKKSDPPLPVVPDSGATSADEEPSSGAEADPPKRELIDVHTHLNPPSFGVYVKLMDQVGIERAVSLSGGSGRAARKEAARYAERFGDRIALFHNIDWSNIDDPEFARDEADALEESVQLGFAGLKVSKALGLGVKTEDGELLKVDDPRLDPIWAKAGELGIPVSIHTSDPKAFFEKPGPENERHEELSMAPGWSFYGDEFPSREALLAQRDRMVKRHPDTIFILVHFANNPEDVDYVAELMAENENVFVDVSARIGEIGRHGAAKVQRIFQRHSGRILFGTDLMLGVFPGQGGRLSYRLTLGSISEERPTLDDVGPFYEKHREYFERSGAPIEHPVPIQGDWKVNPIGLDDETLDAVYRDNAERIIFAPWLARRAAHRVVERATRR